MKGEHGADRDLLVGIQQLQVEQVRRIIVQLGEADNRILPRVSLLGTTAWWT